MYVVVILGKCVCMSVYECTHVRMYGACVYVLVNMCVYCVYVCWLMGF